VLGLIEREDTGEKQGRSSTSRLEDTGEKQGRSSTSRLEDTGEKQGRSSAEAEDDSQVMLDMASDLKDMTKNMSAAAHKLGKASEVKDMIKNMSLASQMLRAGSRLIPPRPAESRQSLRGDLHGL